MILTLTLHPNLAETIHAFSSLFGWQWAFPYSFPVTYAGPADHVVLGQVIAKSGFDPGTHPLDLVQRAIVHGNRELICLYEEKVKKVIERVREG